MILFASGRCDIPAFFSEWFINRYRAGFVDVRNPYNPHQISRIPINAINLDCIVFCTKDPRPLLKYINEIQIPFLFHITITPYHHEIEPGVINKKDILETIHYISSIIGKERIILRYDPIFLSQRYDVAYHERAFRNICMNLHNDISKIIISFIDIYKNTKKNMQLTDMCELGESDMNMIGKQLGEIARYFNVLVQTCAEEIDLNKYHIHKGLCFDKDEIEALIGYPLEVKGVSVRSSCNCLQTVDIGDYNCCIHKCRYCYANYDEEQIIKRMKLHNPNSSVLIGELTDDDNITIRERKSRQITLL